MGPAAVALLAVVRTCSAERDAFAEDAEATDAALRVVAAGGAGAVDAADAIRIACVRATTARRLLGVRPNSDVMHGSVAVPDEVRKGPPGERLGSALRLFARRSESRESRGRATFADLQRGTNATRAGPPGRRPPSPGTVTNLDTRAGGLATRSRRPSRPRDGGDGVDGVPADPRTSRPVPSPLPTSSRRRGGPEDFPPRRRAARLAKSSPRRSRR